MTVFRSIRAARKAAVAQQQAAPAGQGSGIMHFLDTWASGIDYVITHPFQDLTNGLSLFAGLITENTNAIKSSLVRMGGWVTSNPVASLKSWVQGQLRSIYQQVLMLQRQLSEQITAGDTANRRFTIAGLRKERHWRLTGDQASQRKARLEIAALHHLIEREAAGAYSGGKNERLSLIQRLAEHAASRNPVIRGLVSDLVSGLLDLLSVDNPLARIALGFVMKRIISRLGTDQVIGAFAGDLLSGLLDDPRPHDLAGVIRDVSGRLGSVEQQWGQFYQDGGAEILQAGREWSAITSPLASIALTAWLAQAVTEPEAWARELSGVAEGLYSAAEHAVAALIAG